MAAPELDPAAVPQPGSERADGYVDLRSYAPIGDTRTVALVARDGGVDWWPIPHLDATAPFARILDAANGGRLELMPTEDAQTTRRYLPETAVLETTHTTASGVVRVTDSLNTGVAGPLPWTELARRVDGVRGHVPMRWAVAPGTCFNTAAPWARETAHGPVLRVNGITMIVLLDGAACDELTDQAMSGTLTTAPGSRHLVGVSATAGQPLHVPTAREIDDGVDRTIANWQRWSGQFECTGPWDDAVRRSAIILKLLIHGPSGAVAAAATTSLPESRAGEKNWDYRFAWIRDTAYTLKALFRFGLREETQAAVSWLLDTIERHGPEMHVFYNLDGSLPPTEPECPEVPGWRGIGPVVLGNAAASQVQLSVYGDLFDTIQLYVDNGHVVDSAIGRQLAAIADMACDAWRSRDAGMWELERQEHYTSSKLGCRQAFARRGAPRRKGRHTRRLDAMGERSRAHQRVGAQQLLVGGTAELRLVSGHDRPRRVDPAARGKWFRHGTANGGHDRRVARRARIRTVAVPLHRRGRRRRRLSSPVPSGWRPPCMRSGGPTRPGT